MIKRKIIICLLLTGSISACGQFYKKHAHQKIEVMETTKLINVTIKNAFTAWQEGDSVKWLSFFTNDAKLFDDGHPRDFKKFVAEAIGRERFTSIDEVKDKGLSIYGKFHSDTWGDFKTYFKFHFNAQGKIDLLEIGQAE